MIMRWNHHSMYVINFSYWYERIGNKNISSVKHLLAHELFFGIRFKHDKQVSCLFHTFSIFIPMSDFKVVFFCKHKKVKCEWRVEDGCPIICLFARSLFSLSLSPPISKPHTFSISFEIQLPGFEHEHRFLMRKWALQSTSTKEIFAERCRNQSCGLPSPPSLNTFKKHFLETANAWLCSERHFQSSSCFQLII